MATAYVTSTMLTSAPSGIAWVAIPTLSATTPEQAAELSNACWKATSILDTYARQPLRAAWNTESGPGPGMPRVAVDRFTGVGTLITRRWPVREVAAVQYAPAPPYGSFPPNWQAVPQ